MTATPSHTERLARIQRILVCRIDNLGDVLMVFPALRWLRAQHPALRIEMVVRDYARELTERCPWVDRVWLPDQVLEAVEAGAPAPDAVFHLQSTRALLGACVRWGIALRVGNLLRSAHWLRCNRWVMFSKRRMREHESALAWRFFGAVFTPATAPPQWDAWLLQDGWLTRSRPRVLNLPKRLRVLVHPGSKGNGRQWPLPHFAELVRALHARGHSVAITGAPAERAQLAPLLAALPAGVEDAVGRHSLSEFIDQIAQADCLVASGTGPLHVAGACGTHAVGIFPPRVPIGALRWRPIGPRVSTLQTAEPEQCRRACSNLDCACMAAVTPAQVLSAVLQGPPSTATTPP
jgi:ADP-heptose:LPS heptosyltransferase